MISPERFRPIAKREPNLRMEDGGAQRAERSEDSAKLWQLELEVRQKLTGWDETVTTFFEQTQRPDKAGEMLEHVLELEYELSGLNNSRDIKLITGLISAWREKLKSTIVAGNFEGLERYPVDAAALISEIRSQMRLAENQINQLWSLEQKLKQQAAVESQKVGYAPEDTGGRLAA